jgi:ABC-type molybdate transport system ATPase subunit
VKTRFDEIVDFAGVADFVDTPVKRYSSGMNARLGFSIAAHLEPDVLIIDEVLSVGDAAFQRRCLERMFAFRERGTTIVFVSHDLQAISTLCHRALYVCREPRALGPTSEVIAAYLSDSANRTTSSPDASIEMTRAMLLDSTGREALTVSPGADVTVRVDCEVRAPMEDVTFGLILYRSTDNLIVYEGNVVASEIRFQSTRRGSQSIDFQFRANLIRGQYHVECYTLHTPTHVYLSRLSPAAMFSVHDEATCRGVADIRLRASVHEPVLS